MHRRAPTNKIYKEERQHEASKGSIGKAFSFANRTLSWIRSTKQNGSDSSKEFQGMFCCLRAQISSEVKDIRTNSFSFSGSSHYPNPPRVEEESMFDEDGFCGFLAIGTLGADPETPKLGASVADEYVIEEKEMAKLITEKLDKFLEEYPKNSDNKSVEGANAQGDGESHIRPLQSDDLFRSSTELIKRSCEVKKKKGLRTRLIRRRQRVKGESSNMEKHGTRDMIKRVFKKLLGASLKTRNDNDNSMPKKKDDRKNVQIFRTKVHPVLYAHDDKGSCINHYDHKVPSLTGGFLGSGSISGENRAGEYWIKTDTEYLVLEL